MAQTGDFLDVTDTTATQILEVIRAVRSRATVIEARCVRSHAGLPFARVLALIVVSFAVLGVFLLGGIVAARRPSSRARLVVEGSPPAPPSNDASPLVSVLVPARDEESNLDACLASLRLQDYPNVELVVVDDRSSDRTPEILAAHATADPRVLAVLGEEPEPGWFGKPNALRQAVARARGEWLLMTDADTVHTPGSVRAAMAYATREKIAALSALPKMTTDSFWSALLMPQLGALLVVGRSSSRINDAREETVFGNGQYLLVRRDAYEAAGELAAVKDAIDEDVAFARALKRTGLGYHFVDGDAICRTKMYSRLSEFYAGFGKNAWVTLDRSFVRLAKLTVVLFTMSLVPITTALVSAWDLAHGRPSGLPFALVLLGVVQWPAVLAIQAAIRAKNGFPAWLALFAPIGGVVAWSIIAYSAWRWTTGRSVTWKGRTYGGASSHTK